MKTRISVILGAALISGCAATANQMPASSTASQGNVAQNSRISQLERELENKNAELERARTSASQVSATPAMPAGMDGQLFPPNPKAGECYARVLIPADYNTSTETVLVREASERVEIVPARFETVKETVLMKEAETKLVVVPATYKTVEERVLVRPASTKLEEIPATYKTVSETVLVSPARTEWKRGPAASFAASSVVNTRSTDTGEIMCLVEIPARYETVTKTVVDQTAGTREVSVPAEYRTVTTRVIDQPARTREMVVPAEYETVDVTKVVSQAMERRIDIPAEYQSVTKREKTRDEVLEWRQVVCDVNLNNSNVRALQDALSKGGQYSGPKDGILGPQTLGAANSYARTKGLPAGSNYIAMEVVDALGLKF